MVYRTNIQLDIRTKLDFECVYSSKYTPSFGLFANDIIPRATSYETLFFIIFLLVSYVVLIRAF